MPRKNNQRPPKNRDCYPIAAQGNLRLLARDIEEFGRDKDIKSLLKQPKHFTGKGTDVPRELKEWVMAMKDYFALAGYNAMAQGLMGRAKNKNK